MVKAFGFWEGLAGLGRRRRLMGVSEVFRSLGKFDLGKEFLPLSGYTNAWVSG